MLINLENQTPSERYFAMVQTIVPRPIAWVLTDNGNESVNLAPYSFFTGICSDPPLIMISAGKKPSGPEKGCVKDTRRNIAEQKHFVVHIAEESQLEDVNASAETMLHGQSEVDALDIPLADFAPFTLPRLKHSKVAYGCVLHRMDEIGTTPQAVIYGEIKTMYLNDEIASISTNGRLTVDAYKLAPLARLGGNFYCGIGNQLTAKRPD